MTDPLRRLLFSLALALPSLTAATASAQPADPPAEPTPSLPPSAPAAPGTAPVEPAPTEPTPPPEERVAPFGSRHQWVISGGSSAGISSQSFDSSPAKFTSASVYPVVDWFVARNLSLGLIAGLGYSDSKGYGADNSLVETRTASVRVAPRVGWNIPLGESVSLWPTAALGFEWVHETQSVVSGQSASVAGNPSGYPSSTEIGPFMDADLAILWQVRPHFFVGFSGGVFHDFGHVQGGPDVGGQQTELSGGFLVGGWFGGPSAAPGTDPPAPAPRPAPRFGHEGEVVFSSELVLHGDVGHYAGSGSSYSGASITGGLDYFPLDHFSLGLAAGGALGSTTGVDAASGASVSSSSTSAFLEGRAGVDLPLTEGLSFWPRVALGASTSTVDENENGATLENDGKPIFVSLYAPLLVHPVAHFFVGFGPSVLHDLSNPVTAFNASGPPGPSAQNVSTTVGASLVVGGWL